MTQPCPYPSSRMTAASHAPDEDLVVTSRTGGRALVHRDESRLSSRAIIPLGRAARIPLGDRHHLLGRWLQ